MERMKSGARVPLKVRTLRGLVSALSSSSAKSYQLWVGWPYNLSPKIGHFGSEKRAINNYTGATGIKWDCPRQIRIYGRPGDD